MILVPSRPQLSSGNNYLTMNKLQIILAFTLSLLVASCGDWSKPTTPAGGGTKPNTNGGTNPTTGGGGTNPTTGGGGGTKPTTGGGGGTNPTTGGGGTNPTTGGGSGNGNTTDVTIKGSYNVAVLLPFYTDKFVETDATLYNKSTFALDYYAGTQLGLEQLRAEGIKLNVSILDSKKGIFTTLLDRPEVRNADVVIGPAERDNIAAANQYSLANSKTLVSMYYPSGDLDQHNPNFVQINPSLQAHCEALVRDAYIQNPSANITLVCRAKDGESERFQFLQNAYAVASGNATRRLTELPIADETATLATTDLAPYLIKGQTNIFILPTWNETFCQAFLRKVEAQRKGAKVIIYGMPQWAEFNNIVPEQFAALNVHISTTHYAPTDDIAFREFKRLFFERYGKAPSEDAILGFDVVIYTGRMLQKHGSNFASKADMDTYTGITHRIRIKPVGKPGAANERRSAMKYENKEVFILKFKDYKFQE